MAAHIPRRLQRHAQPGERPLAQHFPVVARVATGDPDGARLAVGPGVVPRHREIARREAVVAREILRRAGRAVPLEVGGTGAHYAAVGGELLRRGRGNLQGRLAGGEVETPPHEIYPPGPPAHREPPLWIAGGGGGGP